MPSKDHQKRLLKILKINRNVLTEIIMKLLESEVLKSQLKKSYNSFKSDKIKQLFKKIIG